MSFEQHGNNSFSPQGASQGRQCVLKAGIDFGQIPRPGLQSADATNITDIPAETLQLLANLQTESEEGNPYVFIPTVRWQHILKRRSEGTWQPDYEVINNLTRSIEVFCQWANVDYFTPHDLRRSCITNWARRLPIQTVQHLAGHSNIATTRKYYLSVQSSDMEAAREIQSRLMTSLTNSCRNPAEMGCFWNLEPRPQNANPW